MKSKLVIVLSIYILSACAKNRGNEFDSSSMMVLDAESLAEQGIGEAFEEQSIEFLKVNLVMPKVQELIENNLLRYTVLANDKEYLIYSPDLAEEEWQSWGRATHAFFDIVNTQLSDTDIKFYAFYSGNDLSGMFLSRKQYLQALKIISKNSEKPYIPSLQSPLYGQLQ